jgi:hypothetical protein
MMSNVKDDQIEATVLGSCPKCGSPAWIRFHAGATFALPEAWWHGCDECHYESEPE